MRSSSLLTPYPNPFLFETLPFLSLLFRFRAKFPKRHCVLLIKKDMLCKERGLYTLHKSSSHISTLTITALVARFLGIGLTRAFIETALLLAAVILLKSMMEGRQTQMPCLSQKNRVAL